MKKFILFTLSLFLRLALFAQTLVSDISCDYRNNPFGVDVSHPVLSWELLSSQRNTNQTAYRILVSDQRSLLEINKGDIWDSKKVISAASINVPFSGKKLQSGCTYFWKVMVWDNHHHLSAWSKTGNWQMGLLSPSDWKNAKWIGYEKMPDALRLIPALENPDDRRWNDGDDILPLMRKTFAVLRPVKSATVYITGLGQFELRVNGQKVGDHFLDPGWTKFDRHSLYLTFDITDQLKIGNNAAGIMLGNGFYFIPGERYHKIKAAFGYPKMLCRIFIRYKDGAQKNIVSDSSWKASPGPVTFSSIYGGEDYDAKLEQKGWDQPAFDDQQWKAALVVGGPPELNAQTEEPLKIFDEFTPKKVTQVKPGIWIYDMGQNASAIPFILVSGKKGAVIKITPAELLNDEGLAMQSAVGSPVYYKYTLDGEGTESWQPRFMYYGFRYLQIEGAVPENANNPDQLPLIKEIKSLHTRNAAVSVGSFSCSNELFNNIFSLIDWAIRSNTASVFTDCPHREKLGWLEEAHLVGSSIRYNYNIATLCRKVVMDMRKSQTPEGLIPDIAPEYVQFTQGFRDSPEWGSNGIILPFYLYQWYGDKQTLVDSYDTMIRYAHYLDKKSKNHILDFGLGDWYDLGPKDPGVSQLTPRGITGTAIFYYDLTILKRIAKILGRMEDEQRFTILAKEVKHAFNKAFFNIHSGQYGTGSQSANAMAVYMNLVEPANKKMVIKHIIENIRSHHNGLTAGDIGYRYLLRVLDDAGRSDVIFDMNNRSDVPGYGYQLAMGATSLTESWQGNRISSNNHLMLGHLMEWFYSGLGGIKMPENAIAFKLITIRPQIVGNITKAKVSYWSPYGKIANSWEKGSDVFYMNTEIPVNTSAIVYLPAERTSEITESGQTISRQTGMRFLKYENGKALIYVGSGQYTFRVKTR